LLFYVAQRAVPSLAPRTSRPAEARGAPTIYGRKEVDEIGARYVENVRTLCLVARAHGVEPVLATFMHDMPASVPFPPMALRNNNALLRTLAAEQGIALVDLEDALRSAPRKDYFFADRYHPNREGAELIATTIAAAWR
jgi:lysophospholipase L1-like esterase